MIGAKVAADCPLPLLSGADDADGARVHSVHSAASETAHHEDDYQDVAAQSPVRATHDGSLWTADDVIARDCGSCGTPGSLEEVDGVWVCWCCSKISGTPQALVAPAKPLTDHCRVGGGDDG